MAIASGMHEASQEEAKPAPPALQEPVAWTQDGNPRSARFNDVYHSSSGGVAQAAGVFLAGCGLPERWRGKTGFTVLETGFGLGLNFLTTWAAWEADAQLCGRLHFVSVQAYPVAGADILRAARAVSTGDSLADLRVRVLARSVELAGAWQGLSPGIQELRLAGGQVRLTLAVGEVQPMLHALVCEADAVYLDGFSPACNPDMWSSATLQALARHCRSGTVLASYSTALAVRVALAQAGFRVEKRKGLPPKRRRLQAVFT